MNLTKLKKFVSSGEVRAAAYLATATSIITALSHALPPSASGALGAVGLAVVAAERALAKIKSI